MVDVLRRPLLALSRSRPVERAVSTLPGSRQLVGRFVAGETVEDAIGVATELADAGLFVSLDRLGEETTDRATARAAADAYVELFERLAGAGLAEVAEASMKLSAMGLSLDRELAVEQAGRVCAAAREAGTTVSVDAEASSTTEGVLDVVFELRREFPDVGAVVQAYLHRTEDDCRRLAGSGSRVRLCKGAYDEPADVAFRSRREVDASYERCLRVLMEGAGYPMVATHDPRLVDAALSLVEETGRAADSYELQMLYGVRPDEQRRLARAGHRMRVYVPYGDQWYPYLMRRLAERSANVGFFLRSLATRG